MSLRNVFLSTALTASSLLTGCATTIGGANVTYQPPVDMVGNARGVVTPGRARYIFTHVENANQGAFGGCGAVAIFNHANSGSFASTDYVSLRPKQVENLIEGRPARHGLFVPLHLSQFNPQDLERALVAVTVQAQNNAKNPLCLGYN
ncbi:MAG: hypothetical protein V4621_06500 [Pseudomonadota bacterium]